MSKESPDIIQARWPGILSSAQMISRANRVKPHLEIHQIEKNLPSSITTLLGVNQEGSEPGEIPEGVKQKLTGAQKKND